MLEHVDELDEIDAIAAELERIGAGSDAGEVDSIGVNDELGGWASLGASELRRDFYWYGRSPEILARLSALPDGGGPEVVKAEFHTEVPERLRPPQDEP